MTVDEVGEEVISGIDYAAYRETDSSLHDADKNRLFGSEHYKSGRPVHKPGPWEEGDFEDKMATLLRLANNQKKFSREMGIHFPALTDPHDLHGILS